MQMTQRAITHHDLALDNLGNMAVVITHVAKSDFLSYHFFFVSELRKLWNHINGFLTFQIKFGYLYPILLELWRQLDKPCYFSTIEEDPKDKKVNWSEP